MTSSPMVVTGNHRAWRYVIKSRWHEAADAEIRELAGELLHQLREIAPHTYQDIPSEPYSYEKNDYEPAGNKVNIERILEEQREEIEREKAEIIQEQRRRIRALEFQLYT